MIKLFLLIIITTMASAQQHFIQLVFSERMQMETILNKDNYTLYDQTMQVKLIDKVEAVNDSIVILFVSFLDYKTNYLIKVDNVKDLAGNYINNKNTAWFRFDGFDFGQDKPNFKIRRK